MKRKTPLCTDEIYHLYDRGVDKRHIFLDTEDFRRFFESMEEFNVTEPIESLYRHRQTDRRSLTPTIPLVDIIAYCLNDNHFHFLVRQRRDDGISEWMRKLKTGYTNYFNVKNERSGSLFEGPFKSQHVNTNEYLTMLSAYINLNDRVHSITHTPPGVNRSSYDLYLGGKSDVTCDPSIVLAQFESARTYQDYAEMTVCHVRECRDDRIQMRELMHE